MVLGSIGELLVTSKVCASLVHSLTLPVWSLMWFIPEWDNWLPPSFGNLHDIFWYHELQFSIHGSQGPFSGEHRSLAIGPQQKHIQFR